MIIPIVALFASLAFGAPTALAEPDVAELSKNPETMRAYIEEYFADEPVLANIAWCESRLRHVDASGDVIRGKVDKDDTGIMQINTRYHEEKAEELDLDIHSLAGNLEYAKYLYEKEGTKPWNSSKPCWGKLAAK